MYGVSIVSYLDQRWTTARFFPKSYIFFKNFRSIVTSSYLGFMDIFFGRDQVLGGRQNIFSNLILAQSKLNFY